MATPHDVDRTAVRRQFARRAAAPEGANFLWREVESRMLERLELVKIAPRALLDVGSGTGAGLQRLCSRYPETLAIGIDVAHPMLRAALARREHARSSLGRWLARTLGTKAAAPAHAPLLVTADAHALPLPDASVDLVWSSLAWPWLHDPPAAVREWHRVLRPQGLLMFSALGVDTLRELRALGAVLPEWPDMHDIGDLLVASGFAEPVMDAERLVLTWDDPARLLDELRAMSGNPARARPPGLSTPRARARWHEKIASLRGSDGRIALSIEVIQGHAWCPSRKRRHDGWAPIEVRGRRASGPSH